MSETSAKSVGSSSSKGPFSLGSSSGLASCRSWPLCFVISSKSLVSLFPLSAFPTISPSKLSSSSFHSASFSSSPLSLGSNDPRSLLLIEERMFSKGSSA
ncbi:hypothetical protein CPB83DRAFT_856371 [Crepidotus variabilis]|uniref:Uncharacterized protein n=1 Tax=Crepidotus variabilis TaxID=179855 RepID=A0A9P6EDY3_9AGAR|nr:hypothetical protein CPB83DRAFT_856371 [Crepidotus variabilis]